MDAESLSSLNVGDCCYVKNIETQLSMKRRLYDLGLIPGTKVKCLQKSMFGDPVAFLIRGAVIALRMSDLQKIYIER